MENMHMKVIWIDTETTGLDPVRHDIWQIAYILTDNGREVLRNSIECKPFSPWNADPAALDIGVTMDNTPVKKLAEINYAPLMHPALAVNEFKKDLEKMIDRYDKQDKAAVGGYNVVFDLHFLSWWFKKSLDRYGIGSFTDYTMLDAAPLVRLMRHTGYLKLENTKLVTVCKYYDIALDTAHNALSDVEASMNIYPLVLHDFRAMLDRPEYLGALTA